MKTIKGSPEEEVKIVNQLMAALHMLYGLSSVKEVGRFTVQAIKNVPSIENCCICLRGIETVIGDSSKDAEAILKFMIKTPVDVEDIIPPPLNNQKFELVKLQTSDRKYGYLLFSLKLDSYMSWLKPILSNFINIVASEFERRYQKKELTRYGYNLEKKIIDSEYMLREAQKIAQIGSYVLDINSFNWESTDLLDSLFGIDKNYTRDVKGWINLIHPDDREMMQDYFAINIIKNLEPFDKKYRIIRNNDQEERWVQGKGKLEFDGDGNLSKMIGTIQDITQQIIAHNKIKLSEKHYRALFDSSPVPLWEEDFSEVKKIIDSLKKKGVKNFKKYFDTRPELVEKCLYAVKIISVNDRVLELHDANSKEELFKGLQTIFTNNSLGAFKEELIALAENRNKVTLECEVKTLKGDLKQIKLEWNLEKESERLADKVIISTIDITEQKKAEEHIKKSEVALKEAFSITNLGTFTFDDNTDLFETSIIADKIIGIDKTYKRDIQGWKNLAHPEDYNKVQQFADSKDSESEPIEFRLIRPKDKKVIWTKVYIKKEFNDKGIRTKITGTFQDITERKQAEEALKKSEERWQFAIDGSGLGLWDWNMETDDVFYSTQWKSMLGFNEDEIEHRNEEWEKRVHPEDKERITELTKPHYKGKTKNFSMEYRLLCKDNTYKWILDRGKIISYNKKGEPTRMIGTHTDISKVKKSLEKIEKYSNLVKESLNEIYLFDTVSFKFIDANKVGLKNLGYTLKELKELTPIDLEPKFTLNSFKKTIKPLLDRKEEKIILYKNHQRKDGSLYPIEIHLQLATYNEEEFFSAFILDITERKRVEQDLIKSEKQLSIMFNYAPLGIALVNSLNSHVYKSNLKFSEIIGRNKDEINQIDWMSITHPDDLQEDLDNMALLNSEKITGFKMNKRYIKPNGEIVWVNMTIAPLDVEDKTKPQHLCMIEDITERKIAEIEFLNSQQHLENAQDIAQLGYFETNLKTEKTIWSKGMFQITGHNKDEITPCLNNFNDFVHPDDLEMLNKKHQDMINSKDKSQVEFRIVDKSGKQKWLLTSRQCKEDENGELIIKGVLQDITIRKEAEQTIIKEKELFKAIVNNIPVMITHYNPKANMLSLNTEFEKTIGWSTEDVQIIDLMEKVYPDPEYRKEVIKYTEKASNDWKEFKVLSKSGEIVDSEWSNLKLEDGTQIGIGIDITERKKNEKKLANYQNHLEELVKDRTKELTEKNMELDKTMKVFVGRELKIRELQKKIKQLEIQILDLTTNQDNN